MSPPVSADRRRVKLRSIRPSYGTKAKCRASGSLSWLSASMRSMALREALKLPSWWVRSDAALMVMLRTAAMAVTMFIGVSPRVAVR
ncbi:hypothetical protein D9M69_700700 [compost metagenome]